MAFTVEDFQDLVELLRAHPEWRQRLWELLASEELLRLPAEVKAFREEFEAFRDQTFEAFRQETERRFQRVEEQIAALVEAQRRHYEEFVTLRQEFLEHRQEFLELRREFQEHRQEFLEHRQEFLELRREVASLKNDVGTLKDNDLRRRYRELAHAYFGQARFRKIYVLSASEIVEALEGALDAGIISPEEFQDARLIDLVIRGLWEGQPLHLALEISWTVDQGDVERAMRRAEILTRALGETWPGVAGLRLTEGAQKAIAQMQEQGRPIVVAQDGRIDWPK